MTTQTTVSNPSAQAEKVFLGHWHEENGYGNVFTPTVESFDSLEDAEAHMQANNMQWNWWSAESEENIVKLKELGRHS
jgi:hypothetical protein